MPETQNSASDSQEFNKDVDYWNNRKDAILLKHGFPKHALKHTKVVAVFEVEGKEIGDSDLCLIYNETGKLDDMLGYEPFSNEVEFETVCKKTAGYFTEAYESRLLGLTKNIKAYQERVKEQIGRTWIHNPQEQEGTYEFSGKGYLTRGITEGFIKDEINLIFASVRKRIIEKKLEVRDKVAVGIDYLQVFESDDGKKVYVKDELNQEMKAEESEEFLKEYDAWTMLLPEEN